MKRAVMQCLICICNDSVAANVAWNRNDFCPGLNEKSKVYDSRVQRKLKQGLPFINN